jgi:hypothetical protein
VLAAKQDKEVLAAKKDKEVLAAKLKQHVAEKAVQDLKLRNANVEIMRLKGTLHMQGLMGKLQPGGFCTVS